MSEKEDIDKYFDELTEKEYKNYLEKEVIDETIDGLQGEGIARELEEEERLMELYETETGKDPITSRKTLRKDYIKWKNNGMKEVKEEKEITEIRKTSQLRNWL